MAIPRNAFSQLAEAILEGGARKATKYVSEREVVKATPILYGKQRKFDRRDRSHSILFTFGAPNYAERKYIRKLKAAGVPFPVRRVIMKF